MAEPPAVSSSDAAVLLMCPACAQPSTLDAPITKAQAFSLHSRPAATRKLLLDFDGHITRGTAWNAAYGRSTITSRAYDTVR
jgi:hypothetical protein